MNLDDDLFETKPEPEDDASILLRLKNGAGFTFPYRMWEDGRSPNTVVQYENGVAAIHLKHKSLIYPLTEIHMIEMTHSSEKHLAEWNEWFKETHGGLTHEEFHIMRRRGAIDEKVDFMVANGIMDEQTGIVVKGAVYEVIGDYLDSSHAH